MVVRGLAYSLSGFVAAQLGGAQDALRDSHKIHFRRNGGFTYLALLFMVAIMGTALAATSLVWHTVAQRNKEQELLFVGHAIRSAIGLYYERSPGTAKTYPKTLQDLLEDKRQAQLSRYLRQVYRDPFTDKKDWGIVAGPGETIMGVYSLGKAAPLKLMNFDEDDKEFENKTSVQDWKFVYQPKQAAPAAASPGAPNPNAPTANLGTPSDNSPFAASPAVPAQPAGQPLPPPAAPGTSK